MIPFGQHQRLSMLTWALICLISSVISANSLRIAYDADPVSLDPYE